MNNPMKMRLVVFLATGLALTACSGGTVSSDSPRTGTDKPQSYGTSEPLSAAAQQELQAIVASGRLADLQWPNFSEHSAAVKQFYVESGDRLGWTRGGKPTPQAIETIGILEEADQKGLDSKDYDGMKWPQRLKDLQTPGGATESALVKFDVALTVSAIRYGTDLHLGKIDPKILHKNFDPEREKHDAGEFLWKNVVGAPSVKAARAPIEPPYPAYQRTVLALQKYMQMANEEVADPLPQVKK